MSYATKQKAKHNQEYKRTDELLNKSIHYLYSQLVKNYIVSEVEETTNEYNCAMNKSNRIKDFVKRPGNLFTTKDKEKLISRKLPISFIPNQMLVFQLYTFFCCERVIQFLCTEY